MSAIIVTGAAGFIGSHLASQLCYSGSDVIGLDSFTDYYSPLLKRERVQALVGSHERFNFHELDVSSAEAGRLIADVRPSVVYHLAAQPGVRSQNPAPYLSSNIDALVSLLEACVRLPRPPHVVFASSSSVYGTNPNSPYSVTDEAEHPASVYAATKRAGELLTHAYSHQHGLPITCARFFTVYGPWGRPDMAVWRFAESLLLGNPIRIYGNASRAYTHVADVTHALMTFARVPPARQDDQRSLSSGRHFSATAPWRVLNVGGDTRNRATTLELLGLISSALKIQPIDGQITQEPPSPADALSLAAMSGETQNRLGLDPSEPLPFTPLDVGINRFVGWFRGYVSGRARTSGVARTTSAR